LFISDNNNSNSNNNNNSSNNNNTRQQPTNNIGPWESTDLPIATDAIATTNQQHPTMGRAIRSIQTTPQIASAIVPSRHRAIVVRLIVESVKFYVTFQLGKSTR